MKRNNINRKTEQCTTQLNWDSLKAQDLIDEMNRGWAQAASRCGIVLDDYFPCFEKTVEIKLKDINNRIPEQIITFNILPYLQRQQEDAILPAEAYPPTDTSYAIYPNPTEPPHSNKHDNAK